MKTAAPAARPPQGLLVVGSVALDTVETPLGRRVDALGGSAVYFAWAASFFGPVRLVGVVGQDFPDRHRRLLESRGIDTAGLQVVAGKTFRWHGRYQGDMNVAETVAVELNVFGQYDPVLPEGFRDSAYVFLANGGPSVQQRVRRQTPRARFVVADTMNLWIETARDDLLHLLGEVDALVLNDQEARQLTGHSNLVRAGRAVLALGPRYCLIKKGEHGAMLLADQEVFVLPAYPVEGVVDPTGAGDSFAGGLMGYLAQADRCDLDALKQGMAYGTVIASLNVEDFSLDRLQRTTREEIEGRLAAYRRLMQF